MRISRAAVGVITLATLPQLGDPPIVCTLATTTRIMEACERVAQQIGTAWDAAFCFRWADYCTFWCCIDSPISPAIPEGPGTGGVSVPIVQRQPFYQWPHVPLVSGEGLELAHRWPPLRNESGCVAFSLTPPSDSRIVAPGYLPQAGIK